MKIQIEEKGENSKFDLQKIVHDLLHDNLATDVASSGGVGCDNMTCILILLKSTNLKKSLDQL